MTDNHITELYAWVVDDPSGEHGMIGVMGPNGPMQAVTSQRHVAEMMRPFAEAATKELGLPVMLVRFTKAETVDVA